MIRPLIFAGTTEGREIALFFNENKVMSDVYTATEYGVQVLPEMEYIKAHAGRLAYEEICSLLESRKQENIIIIDATHPYASIVTENLYKSAVEKSVPYFRLLRPSTYKGGGIMFESIEKAVEYLKNTTGNILLATGSKELIKYKPIGDMARLYPRVLPESNVIKNILDLGYMQKNIICMQGPFSVDMNTATLKHINGKYLVTKDTGKTGGFDEKLEAAKSAGAELIVIGRPEEKSKGYSLDELKKIMQEEYIQKR